jgi:hypothetical protein
MAGRAAWRLRKRHVAIHPRVAGDSDRDTWRFSQGYLAIAIAAYGDSAKGIWRSRSRHLAIQPRVFGDWDRDTWRFRQGYLAIGIAACGDSPEGGGDCRGERWRLPWRTLAIAVANVGDCRGERWRLPSAHASPIVAQRIARHAEALRPTRRARSPEAVLAGLGHTVAPFFACQVRYSSRISLVPNGQVRSKFAQPRNASPPMAIQTSDKTIALVPDDQ